MATPLVAERHVVRPLGLNQEAQSALRIPGREHRHVAVVLDIAVVERGLFHLVGILGQ